MATHPLLVLVSENAILQEVCPAIKDWKKQMCRAAHTPNYTVLECTELLDIIESILSIGAENWELVASRYNPWAHANGRALRNSKYPKGKFTEPDAALPACFDLSGRPSVFSDQYYTRIRNS